METKQLLQRAVTPSNILRLVQSNIYGSVCSSGAWIGSIAGIFAKRVLATVIVMLFVMKCANGKTLTHSCQMS